MNPQDTVARCRQHVALRRELNRQGPLYADERELLLDAADALLFDEAEAALRRIEALELLDALEVNERRTPGETQRLRVALEGCGVAVLVAA